MPMNQLRRRRSRIVAPCPFTGVKIDKTGVMNWGGADFLLETNHHGFRFQTYSPNFFHAMLNLFFEGEKVRGCGASAVYDCERVFAGNADVSKAESFRKSGVLHQPRR